LRVVGAGFPQGNPTKWDDFLFGSPLWCSRESAN
jgi:hypothetical protein